MSSAQRRVTQRSKKSAWTSWVALTLIQVSLTGATARGQSGTRDTGSRNSGINNFGTRNLQDDLLVGDSELFRRFPTLGEIASEAANLEATTDQQTQGNINRGQADVDQPPALPTPLTRQWMAEATVGPVPLAESVAALSRINRWVEVDTLLRGLNPATLSPETQAEMGKRIGPTAFVRISSQPNISPEAKTNLSALVRARNQRSRSPQRIATAIGQLESNDQAQKANAARILFAGGDASLAALAKRLVVDAPDRMNQDLFEIYVRFGGQAIGPLETYALYGEAPAREKAISLLQRFAPAQAYLASLASLHAVDASEAEKTVAAGMVSQAAGTLPSVQQTIAALRQDLDRKREFALRINRDQQTQTLWIIDPLSGEDRSTVQSTDVTRLIAAYRDRADAAARLRRQGVAAPQLQQAILAADLAYQILVDPQWGSSQQVESLIQSIAGGQYGEALLMASLRQSIEQNDDAAVLGLLRLIAGDRRLDPRRLLTTGTASVSALVDLASSHPNSRIRYEATLIVTDLAQQADRPIVYPGSSRVKRTLAEMVTLRDLPKAAIVETREAIVVGLEKILIDAGYQPAIVSSVAQLVSQVNAGGDLQLILAKTQLWDATPIELIDRVRRRPPGRRVPIIFYQDSETSRGEETDAIAQGRWDAATTLIPRPATPEALAGVLLENQRLVRIEPLTPAERRDFQLRARQILMADRS